MEADILDVLEDLGYPVDQLEEGSFDKALEEGQRSPEFTHVVSWLTVKLQEFLDLIEHVNPITDPDDSDTFMLELSAFLREIGCPLSTLTVGTIDDRLGTKELRLQLLNYLTMELASVMMLAVNKPIVLISNNNDAPTTNYESDVASCMKSMLIALGFSKPPANITPQQLFSKLEAKIKEMIMKNPNQLGRSMLKSRLSDKQWAHLLSINESLDREYQTRREMLIKRMDVTVQSFMWSDKAKQKEKQIRNFYEGPSKKLTARTNIGIPQILAARDSLLRIQKTSSGEAREKTKCAINKVRIGQVPDRGGRAWEHEPPPPEMPAFQQRNTGQSGGGGRGGGGGGGFQSDRGGGRGGGRVQSNWNDQKQPSQNMGGGQWNQGGGGHYHAQRQNTHGGYQQQQSYQNSNNYQQGYSQQNYQSYSGGDRGGRDNFSMYGQNTGGGGYDGYNNYQSGGSGGHGGYKGGGGGGGGGQYNQYDNQSYQQQHRGGRGGRGSRGGRGRGRY